MRRIFIDFAIVFSSIFLLFFAFSKIDYLGTLEKFIEDTELEVKVGNAIWEYVQMSNPEVANPELDSLVNHFKDIICNSNNIPSERVKIHLVYNQEVNAFALPNHHMVIYSGLILACKSPEELMGVMAHEIAHMELNHVMKKLTKELGIATLVIMIGGNGGIELITEVMRVVSSSAYSRRYEREADQKAVEYLENANINPVFFSNFLMNLEKSDDVFEKSMYWISTHPDSQERISNISSLTKRKSYMDEPILTQEEWERIQSLLGEDKYLDL